MPDVKLNAADAAELAEMLQFLTQWLARDPGRLGALLAEFVGHPAYNVGQLRQDLERFVFLLGGGDGEALFGPGWPGHNPGQPATPGLQPQRRSSSAHALRALHVDPRAAPALTVLRIPLRGTRLRRAADPRDRCGPWEQEERAGPGLPRAARGAQPRRWQATGPSRTSGHR